MRKIYKHLRENSKIYQLLIFAAVSVVLVLQFKETEYFDRLEIYAADNLVPIFILLVILKIIAIIWPPFPAAIFIAGMLPIIGFWAAFLADYVGEIIGSSIAYFIAYKYGYKGISLFLDQKNIEKIKRIKIKKGRELEFLLILRVLGNAFFEIMCYGAGLLKISYKNFLISTIVPYFFIGFATYKLIEGLYDKQSAYISAVLLGAMIIFFVKFGSRYLDHEESEELLNKSQQ